MLLYNSQVSGNCYKVRLLFAHLGLAYQTREIDVVDRTGRLELLGEINPALRVPTLVLDDGRSLGESNAILWYFSERSAYLPEDSFERAKVLQWLFFEQYSHEPNIAVLRFLLLYSKDPPTEWEIETRRKGGLAALSAMERHLTSEPFLVASQFTIADIALYAYTHVAHQAGFDLTDHPAIRAWIERVANRPGHVPITV